MLGREKPSVLFGHKQCADSTVCRFNTVHLIYQAPFLVVSVLFKVLSHFPLTQYNIHIFIVNKSHKLTQLLASQLLRNINRSHILAFTYPTDAFA